ncbi:phosphatidylinositol-specific phospholipase C domain-containing protein [Bacillus thuringiensis]|uniref:phosphatidylinositol-specific phospholipase C domain-containing protein n=1 Tax=Bacillus thuringiensis TaxID=1428 RepID=UPI0033965C6A
MQKNQQQISNFNRSDLIRECTQCKRVDVNYRNSLCVREGAAFSACPTIGQPNIYEWMKNISDNKRLSDLSIPGTHNTMASGANIPPIYNLRFVETQTLSLWNQMAAGIRFLDIRLRYENGSLACYHGIVWLGKYFGDVLELIRDYLVSYPSETIYMRIAQENSNAPVADFVSSVRSYTDSYANGLRYTGGTNNQNPTLAQTRGKFVILLDISGYNSSTHGSTGINYRDSNRQDAYLTIGDAKVAAVLNHLQAANNRGSSNTTIYINYLSANLGEYGDLAGTPFAIAKFVNPRIYNYLINQPFNYVGIVVADYPGGGLIRETIYKNFGLPFSGYYQIVTALNNSSVIDMDREGCYQSGQDCNVHLWTNNRGANQLWSLSYDPSKQAYLIISSQKTDSVLAWNVPSNNRNVIVTRFNPTYDEHYWIIERFQNGYIFKNKKDPNLVLDVVNSAEGNGTNIVVHDRHPLNTTYRNQTFLVRPNLV